MREHPWSRFNSSRSLAALRNFNPSAAKSRRRRAIRAGIEQLKKPWSWITSQSASERTFAANGGRSDWLTIGIHDTNDWFTREHNESTVSVSQTEQGHTFARLRPRSRVENAEGATRARCEMRERTRRRRRRRRGDGRAHARRESAGELLFRHDASSLAAGR